MKHRMAVLFLLTAGLAAAAGAAQEGNKSAAGRKAPSPAPSLPAGAEKIGEGKWRARDAQGRTWIYRRTPFGLVRLEEGAAEERESAAPNLIRVREASGTRIVFERRTPFGLSTWTKSPEQLDEDERQALEAWRQSAEKKD